MALTRSFRPPSQRALTNEVLYQLSYVGNMALQCGSHEPGRSTASRTWNTHGTWRSVRAVETRCIAASSYRREVASTSKGRQLAEPLNAARARLKALGGCDSNRSRWAAEHLRPLRPSSVGVPAPRCVLGQETTFAASSPWCARRPRGQAGLEAVGKDAQRTYRPLKGPSGRGRGRWTRVCDGADAIHQRADEMPSRLVRAQFPSRPVRSLGRGLPDRALWDAAGN